MTVEVIISHKIEAISSAVVLLSLSFATRVPDSFCRFTNRYGVKKLSIVFFRIANNSLIHQLLPRDRRA